MFPIISEDHYIRKLWYTLYIIAETMSWRTLTLAETVTTTIIVVPPLCGDVCPPGIHPEVAIHEISPRRSNDDILGSEFCGSYKAFFATNERK